MGSQDILGAMLPAENPPRACRCNRSCFQYNVCCTTHEGTESRLWHDMDALSQGSWAHSPSIVLSQASDRVHKHTAHVQAVSEGRWLLIEDINLAPPDVLASLVGLLERRQLYLPQRAQSVPTHPGFQLIASVTCSPGVLRRECCCCSFLRSALCYIHAMTSCCHYISVNSSILCTESSPE